MLTFDEICDVAKAKLPPGWELHLEVDSAVVELFLTAPDMKCIEPDSTKTLGEQVLQLVDIARKQANLLPLGCGEVCYNLAGLERVDFK